jgi:hypothetical protein
MINHAGVRGLIDLLKQASTEGRQPSIEEIGAAIELASDIVLGRGILWSAFGFERQPPLEFRAQLAGELLDAATNAYNVADWTNRGLRSPIRYWLDLDHEVDD